MNKAGRDVRARSMIFTAVLVASILMSHKEEAVESITTLKQRRLFILLYTELMLLRYPPESSDYNSDVITQLQDLDESQALKIELRQDQNTWHRILRRPEQARKEAVSPRSQTGLQQRRSKLRR